MYSYGSLSRSRQHSRPWTPPGRGSSETSRNPWVTRRLVDGLDHDKESAQRRSPACEQLRSVSSFSRRSVVLWSGR